MAFRAVALGPAKQERVIHRLYRYQVVAGTLPEVFGFFKNPGNLGALTPPWLGFKILEPTDHAVRVGTRIRYRLSWHGIPLHWESLISEYVEDEMFADEQIRGPYRLWHHRHQFRSVPGGVAIEDIVNYQLPLGVLGSLAHVITVRQQLQGIFDYRARAIVQHFPELR